MFKNKLKKKAEFYYVFSARKYMRFDSFIIQYAKRIHPFKINHPRYGIIASKKIGNAGKRNFAKRRIRALENIIKSFGDNNLDYVLVIKKNILSEKFDKLTLELKNALNKIKVLT